MEKGCRGVKFPPPNRCREFTPQQHQLVRQNYAAMIENIDRLVGEFVAKVKQRGEAANTLIVFSSDHGEMLGDHSLWNKRHPYQASAGVPLIAHGPGVRAGVTVDDPATTLDLTATFLDYAGIARPAKMDSRSLREVFGGKRASLRGHVLSGMDDWRMVLQGPHKYIRGWKQAGEGPLLFDLRHDPLENENLANRNPQLARRLAGLLDQAKV
jgi:arylsulfatase A-like enzyme